MGQKTGKSHGGSGRWGGPLMEPCSRAKETGEKEREREPPS